MLGWGVVQMEEKRGLSRAREGGDVWGAGPVAEGAELARPSTAWQVIRLARALSQHGLLPRVHAGAHRPGLLPAEQEEEEPRAQRDAYPGGTVRGPFRHRGSPNHCW